MRNERELPAHTHTLAITVTWNKMAAYKASNKNVQCDKCINKCAGCIKLQSKLNEVRLELKSVIEIVNIRNRDLALIDVRTHNLHEQVTSLSTTQPFENWPSRHTVKKSYCDVSIHKPFPNTNNRFQLLDNPPGTDHQEGARGGGGSTAKREYRSAVEPEVLV
jgi:hypothetical protein